MGVKTMRSFYFCVSKTSHLYKHFTTDSLVLVPDYTLPSVCWLLTVTFPMNKKCRQKKRDSPWFNSNLLYLFALEGFLNA